MATRISRIVPSSNRGLFADRIAEAKGLYEIAKGGDDEEICWNYYHAVIQLAQLAQGENRNELRELLCA